MNLPVASQRPLTQHIDVNRAAYDLAQYEAVGGYHSVRKILEELSPDEGLDILKASNLRGRGGAGFPTGMKSSPSHRLGVRPCSGLPAASGRSTCACGPRAFGCL